MAAEGALGLIAGVAAGSIALVGWALGSAIEALASVIVVWRFPGSRMLSESAERRVQKAVAVSFWLLAPGRCCYPAAGFRAASRSTIPALKRSRCSIWSPSAWTWRSGRRSMCSPCSGTVASSRIRWRMRTGQVAAAM
jgi:hypothetical protein